MTDRDATTAPRPGGFLGPVTRRKALKWLGIGAGSAVGIAAVGVGGLFALRGCAPAVAGLRVLSAQGYRTLNALIEVLVPAGGAFPERADGDRLARLLDSFLADEPEQTQDDLTLALDLVEFGPVLFDLRTATFSHLSAEEQQAHWEGWGASDSLTRRKVFVAFRKFVMLVFYDDPAIWPRIGYPGPFG